jgi:hypothetical protein
MGPKGFHFYIRDKEKGFVPRGAENFSHDELVEDFRTPQLDVGLVSNLFLTVCLSITVLWYEL